MGGMGGNYRASPMIPQLNSYKLHSVIMNLMESMRAKPDCLTASMPEAYMLGRAPLTE